MYLVAIAWMYVVAMMALAEALSPQGSVLGAVITFVFYGLLPLSIVLYVMGTPMRRRARMAAEREEAQREAAEAGATAQASAAQPDGGGHAAGAAVAAERKEV